MSEAHKQARRIFREWCEEHGLVFGAMTGADLVARIEAALSTAPPSPIGGEQP